MNSTTNTMVICTFDNESSADYLFRFSKETTSSSWNVAVTETDNLRHWLQTKEQEVNILQKLVNWQHKIIDYNSHYCAFLLGQVDEDEFESIAKQFSYEIKEDIDPELLTSTIEKVYKLTKIEYTPSDLASLFECKTEDIIQAIKPLALKNNKLNKMLPKEIQK